MKRWERRYCWFALTVAAAAWIAGTAKLATSGHPMLALALWLVLFMSVGSAELIWHCAYRYERRSQQHKAASGD